MLGTEDLLVISKNAHPERILLMATEMKLVVIVPGVACAIMAQGRAIASLDFLELNASTKPL